MRDHERARWGGFGVLSASIGSMLAAGLRGHSILDPALVSMRYARHLGEGSGLVFNLGERVEGFSDPLWTMLLGVLAVSGVAPMEAATILGVACLGLLVALVGWVGTRTLGEGPGVLAAVLVAAWPPMWVAARSLDDGLFQGVLLVWTAGLLLGEREGSRSGWTCLALGLTALTGLLGALCAMVLAAGAAWRRPTQLGRVLVVLGVLSALTALRWAYFADPIPAYLRAMPWGGSGRWSSGWDWLLQLLREAPAVAGLGLIGAAWALVRVPGWRPVAVIVGLGLALCVGAAPARVLLWHPLIPIVGLLVLLGAGALSWLGQAVPPARALLVLVLLGFAAQDVRVAYDRSIKVDQARRGRFVQGRALARFLALRFPSGEAVAAHKIGVIGQFMDNPIIDLSGRADGVISRSPRRDLRAPGAPLRSDIPSAVARSPVVFVHPRSMAGKRQGRIQAPPWYPDDFDGSYATVALSSREHWELTTGEQIWVFFFLRSGLEPVPAWMKNRE